MSREVHVRFCEGVGVQFPRATRLLVLSPTRWKLRRAVRAVNGVLGALRLEKHPDKTFIGRIDKGFDFLGYHFGPEGLRVAKTTIQNFVEHASRLYEQERERPNGPSSLGMYVRRWLIWTRSGLARAGPRPRCQSSRARWAPPSPAQRLDQDQGREPHQQ